jgi:hypothetical protein
MTGKAKAAAIGSGDIALDAASERRPKPQWPS